MAKPAGKFESIRALAKAIGVSHVNVSKWVKHPLWTLGKGPWPAGTAEKAKAWAEKYLRPANQAVESSPPDAAQAAGKGKLDKYDLQCRLIVQQELGKRIDNGLQMGLLIKKADVEARELRQVMAVKSELMGVKQLALKMESMDLPQREILLEQWAQGVCAKFAAARDEAPTA